METITKNEMEVMLKLFKDLEHSYNANNLSKEIKLTPMGTLKILKKMEKNGLVISQQLGKAIFYKPDLKKEYTRSYIKLILQREAEQSPPKIKRWVNESKEFDKYASIGIIFGSILTKPDPEDIDLLLVLKKKNGADNLVKEKNKVNIKKMHLVKQTIQDLKKNMKKKDMVLLSILRRGIVVFGHEKLIEVIKDATR